MDVLENMCERMKLYRARAGPEFPYIKGGMYMSVSIAAVHLDRCFEIVRRVM